MKILYLSGSSFPSVVSHTLSKMRMCQALSDAGHNVLLSAATGSDDKDVIGYYGLRGGFKLALKKLPSWLDSRLGKVLRSVLLAFHHRQILKSFLPDLVYSRLTIAELMLLPRDIPIIYEMHSLGPVGQGGLKGLIFHWLIRHKHFCRIIVTTNALAKMLNERLPETEIVVARLSAETPIEIDAEVQSVFCAQNLHGKGFDHHVGYTGNLDTVGLRGTEIICQCAGHLSDVAFHVVGGDGEVVKYWNEYAMQHNIHGNLFFYGHRNPLEMPYFLGCFDVVVAPLQWKPSRAAPIGAGMSPLKLPQYMAYRKTIVASDIPAHREVLSDGKNALLVNCDDVDLWVNAIQHLLLHPDQSRMMGDAALNTYLLNYTPKKRVEKILNGLTVD